MRPKTLISSLINQNQGSVLKLQVAVRAKNTQFELPVFILTGLHSVHVSDPGESATDPSGQDEQLLVPELPVLSLYVPLAHS